METLEYIGGMNLAVGFNTATHDIHPTPALDKVDIVRDVIAANGQEVLQRIELASSTLSLSKQLNISATTTLKFAGIASGSFKIDFINSFKQNSYSVYIFVNTKVKNRERLLDLSKSKLRPEAAQLYMNSSQDFIQQYGNSFVYGYTTGGEFLGILEIESSSSEDFQDIKSKLSGKGVFGSFSGSASASFQQALNEITQGYTINCSLMRTGSHGGILQNINAEELIQKALSFPTEVENDRGCPYTVIVIPYEHIEHPIGAPLDVVQQAEVLEKLAELRLQFTKIQNDLEFAIAHNEQFPGVSINELNERFNKISNEVSKITTAARVCFDDKTRCNLPDLDLTLLEKILPLQQGEGQMNAEMNRLQERLNGCWETLTGHEQRINECKQALDQDKIRIDGCWQTLELHEQRINECKQALDQDKIRIDGCWQTLELHEQRLNN
jgi:hypothetical protein